MNQNLINKYQISFINKILDFKKWGKEISKIPNTININLTNFLIDFNAKEINELLLPDINQALSAPSDGIESGSETTNIIMYYDKVDFYDDNGLVYRLPTQDFKEIVIGWRDFLLSSPLNGTKV